MSKLNFTIGIPRSGKSTYCSEWVQAKPMRVIVSSDDIRLALSNQRYNPYTETFVFATKHVMIRALLNRGFEVMVDGTHSTEISITRLLEIDIDSHYVIIPTTAEVCIERAIKTSQEDLIPSIKRISTNIKNMGDIPSFVSEIRRKVKERNLYGVH